MSARSLAVSSPDTPWISDALRATVLGLPTTVRSVVLRRSEEEPWVRIGEAVMQARPGDTFVLRALDRQGQEVVTGVVTVPQQRVDCLVLQKG